MAGLIEPLCFRPNRYPHLSIALLELIQNRLDEHSPAKKLLRRFKKRSAVAMVLSVRDGELHILMIKRAEREGDPWSGHMAFPGGRVDPKDANAFAAALRETDEEVGLRLVPDEEYIGRLSDLSARPRFRTLGMTVTPFVFRLHREVEFTPNYEVAEVVWVPMEFLLNSDNLEQMTWEYKNMKIPVPCYQYNGYTIWGLSLMMLGELLELIDGTDRRRMHVRRR